MYIYRYMYMCVFLTIIHENSVHPKQAYRQTLTYNDSTYKFSTF